jgi:hypothetical protein
MQKLVSKFFKIYKKLKFKTQNQLQELICRTDYPLGGLADRLRFATLG